LGVGTSDLETVFSDLDTLSLGAGAKILKSKAKAAATHKMHRKAPRRKDRSWRVQNDESDGMPLVRAIQKPVSHGAAHISRVAA
jgi:large subunit GTPase 1